ncbi:MAG: hypothetical protein ABL921_14710 [Pirellula sp.]
MARLSWTQRLYWRYFSKPVSQRGLYLHAIETPCASILEIGIGSGERIKQLLSLCTPPAGVAQIRYAGVDPFESADDGKTHLHLKSAHRMLAEFGVKAHLIPGDASNALARVAHTVLPSDLIIIDGDWESNTVQGRAIHEWLPRLCHAKSTIFASSLQGGLLSKYAPPANAMEQIATRKAA